MKKHLYLFSGLGADERVFQRLDFSGYDVTYIQWISPLPNEKIEHYAGRILPEIKTKNPILIGLSFGGLIAIEVAKLVKYEQIILIASAKTKFEIPLYYRLAGWLGLYRLVPASILKRSNFITEWMFGAHSPSDKKLLKQILQDTDAVFLKWAMGKIARWENTSLLKNTTHIHGTSDKVLPVWFAGSNHKVKDGGHLMTLNKHEEITRLIKTALTSP